MNTLKFSLSNIPLKFKIVNCNADAAITFKYFFIINTAKATHCWINKNIYITVSLFLLFGFG